MRRRTAYSLVAAVVGLVVCTVIALTAHAATKREPYTPNASATGAPQATPPVTSSAPKTVDPAAAVGGGFIAPAGMYPYLVTIYNGNGSNFCTGALIGPTYVVTARHCFSGNKPAAAVGSSVVIGGLQAYSSQPNGETRKVVKVLYDANASLAQNPHADFAILQLDRPSTKPYARLNGRGGTFVGDKEIQTSFTLIAGYGFTDKTNSNGPLHHAPLPVVVDANKALIRSVGSPPYGMCPGDSGGPLVLKKPGYDVLLGVLTFGLWPGTNQACGTPHQSVFVDARFIAETMKRFNL